MAGVSTNYGWDFVNSGADPVSGPANFAHVQQIDTTLKQISGNVMSTAVGTANISAVANSVTTTHVTISPAMSGDSFKAFVTPHTSLPGVVVEVAVLNETSTGFDIMGYRTSSTDYSVNWVMYGIEEA